ncbi:MAG TPA: hemolysin family protein [Nitrospinota bacterium]|nr:hemolysin family protein [Nitrospinota bacterium]|tara:strand:+ start:17049 stop:18332 length:1284 start_codon:yes stop_codon:yes gene_type:complete
MDDINTIRIISIIILLCASAFFSGSEIALFSLSRAQVIRMKKSGGGSGLRVATLLDNPHRLLVTIYIGNEIINVAISAIATFVALDLFGQIGIAIALGGGVFTLLVLGEITPKTYAHNNNEKWAHCVGLPLTFFMYGIWPVQVVITWIANSITHLFGLKDGTEQSMLNEDELKTLVDESADEGIIEVDEKELIHNVFELDDVLVSEIMTPRTEILALEINTPLKEAWDKMVESYYARAPVYDEVIDNVKGILFKKDLLRFNYPPPSDVKLKDLIREPFIIPETLHIKELLGQFKLRKSHMAIIMDEYGGMQGVITLDDILDELVGQGKHLRVDKKDEIIRIGHGTHKVVASLSIEDFNRFFKTSIEHEDIETIGGYVFHLFGRAPKWGESILLNDLEFVVEKIKGHKIIELRVKLNGNSQPNNAQKS